MNFFVRDKTNYGHSVELPAANAHERRCSERVEDERQCEERLRLATEQLNQHQYSLAVRTCMTVLADAEQTATRQGVLTILERLCNDWEDSQMQVEHSKSEQARRGEDECFELSSLLTRSQKRFSTVTEECGDLSESLARAEETSSTAHELYSSAREECFDLLASLARSEDDCFDLSSSLARTEEECFDLSAWLAKSEKRCSDLSQQVSSSETVACALRRTKEECSNLSASLERSEEKCDDLSEQMSSCEIVADALRRSSESLKAQKCGLSMQLATTERNSELQDNLQTQEWRQNKEQAELDSRVLRDELAVAQDRSEAIKRKLRATETDLRLKKIRISDLEADVTSKTSLIKTMSSDMEKLKQKAKRLELENKALKVQVKDVESLKEENMKMKRQLRYTSRSTSQLDRLPATARKASMVEEMAELECRSLLGARDSEKLVVKKKLLLKWHPDRQPNQENSAFATQVMQEMQNRPEWGDSI